MAINYFKLPVSCSFIRKTKRVYNDVTTRDLYIAYLESSRHLGTEGRQQWSCMLIHVFKLAIEHCGLCDFST